MDNYILQLQNVSKNFGGIVVLDDVSLDVAKGARHALIGPNGAGKTTLFNLISGVFPIDSGTALFEEQHLSSVPSRKRIRMVSLAAFRIYG